VHSTATVPHGRDQGFSPLAAAASLVDALASSHFESALLGFVSGLANARHVAAYRFDEDGSQVVAACSANGSKLALHTAQQYAAGAYWKRDPGVTIYDASEGTSAQVSSTRVSSNHVDPDLRQLFYLRPGVCEKLSLVTRRPSGVYGLSVFRDVRDGSFNEASVARVAQHSELLMSCVGRHEQLKRVSPVVSAFSSVKELELRLATADPNLSPRERQVCARILFGMSAQGAGLDLDIAFETVVTYRKRAYGRLRISTKQELFDWFITRL
jgi:DNA-binding CsgD family transcriptional regulator